MREKKTRSVSGKALKMAMKKAGMTQRDLCNIAGITEARLSRIASAEGAICRTSTLERIAGALDISVGSILVAEMDAPLHEGALSSQERELVAFWRSLRLTEQADMIAAMNNITKTRNEN